MSLTLHSARKQAVLLSPFFLQNIWDLKLPQPPFPSPCSQRYLHQYSCAGLFGGPVKDTLGLEVDMEVHSTNHTTNAQLLSTSPSQTEAHSCCFHTIQYTPAGTHPHPNMTAENKSQQLPALLHKGFETELKHTLLEKTCHHHPLLQRLDLQETPLKPR